MKFNSNKTYTLTEIEKLTGTKPTYNKFHDLYSVVDTDGDFAQYDFAGDPDHLRLVLVDGERHKTLTATT